MKRAGLVALACVALGCVEPSPPMDAGMPIGMSGPDCLRLPATIDFGTAELGSQSSRQFFLFNATTFPLAISIEPIREPFATNVAGSVTVLSGHQISLRIDFTPTDARLQLQELIFVGGAGCTPQHVQLTGIGAGELSGPGSFGFGAVPLGRATTRAIPITNSRRVSQVVTILASEFGTTGGFTVPSSLLVPAGATVDLLVTVNPDAGAFLSSNLTLRSQLDLLQISIDATSGIPRPTLWPTSIDLAWLPTTSVLQPRIRQIAVANSGDGPLLFSQIEVVPGRDSLATELSVSAPGVGAGETGQIEIFFAPDSRLGPREWVVRFTTNDRDAPPLELPITANVQQLDQCETKPSYAPTILVFDGGTVYPARASITFTNTGSTSCLLDDVRLTDPHWSLSPSANQYYLAPMAQQTVSVELDGGGAGLLLLNAFGANPGDVQIPIIAN